MYYSGLDLDRASARRTDPGWISSLLAAPQLQVIPVWRSQCLIRAGQPARLAGGTAAAACAAAGSQVFLGLAGAVPLFAADLSALDRAAALRIAAADDSADVRSVIGAVSQDEAGLHAYARGILGWHARQQFCGSCGGRTESRDGGHARTCRDCDAILFPRIEPAIIVLAELPGQPRRCLLGRHQGAAAGRFSTLAGFVEVGENLEDAVRREVAEEAGVAIGPVRYQGSQAWPFPAGLMAGFRAEALSAEIAADGAELLEARWFTAAELRRQIAVTAPRPDSIGRILIESWLADSDGALTDG
jgi:NAD+ diphosphatase